MKFPIQTRYKGAPWQKTSFAHFDSLLGRNKDNGARTLFRSARSIRVPVQ